MNPERRQLLAWGAAAAAGAMLAPGLRLVELAQARSPEEAASKLQRWGLLIDIAKCGECDACVTACHEENGVTSRGRPTTDPQWIRKVSLADRQTGYVQTLPLMCQHCEHPPCVDVCPTGASFKRADGIVLVDKHTCIGCRYCVMACPYAARSFVHEATSGQKPDVPRGKGTVESCTLCVHRVDRGDTPACVVACNRDGGRAMAFGDLNDKGGVLYQRLRDEPSSQIRADLALNTGVRYQGL
ncbi:MAG: 4Fe-4S dicluster domain-containing protein [Betaproteobacteria bacterium]|nr:4Fe-4S dicluster domain-containing protein [Betaproteobacteria bacterium]MDH5221206.1 4Fe-4S dicluster domain-containing protein [Betaproteobacteria bacterium]MDH5352683.1 4Fe-4S dicluster domain-containing protein [Betaproteobacteria bacterium]